MKSNFLHPVVFLFLWLAVFTTIGAKAQNELHHSGNPYLLELREPVTPIQAKQISSALADLDFDAQADFSRDLSTISIDPKHKQSIATLLAAIESFGVSVNKVNVLQPGTANRSYNVTVTQTQTPTEE